MLGRNFPSARCADRVRLNALIKLLHFAFVYNISMSSALSTAVIYYSEIIRTSLIANSYKLLLNHFGIGNLELVRRLFCEHANFNPKRAFLQHNSLYACRHFRIVWIFVEVAEQKIGRANYSAQIFNYKLNNFTSGNCFYISLYSSKFTDYCRHVPSYRAIGRLTRDKGRSIATIARVRTRDDCRTNPMLFDVCFAGRRPGREISSS
jgi:hypothetical protein